MPDWVHLRNPSVVRDFWLDAGETAALSLALEHRESVLLIDEREGRRIARQHHLAITGTLEGVREAASANLIDLPDAVRRLQRTNFKASPALIQQILDGGTM